MNPPLFVFEALQPAVPHGSEMDRSGIAHAWSEAGRATPGDASQWWWQWLIDTGASLGLRLRGADLTLQELSVAAGSGAKVVVRAESSLEQEEGWMVVLNTSGNRVCVIDADHPTGQRIGRKALGNRLGITEAKQRVRCVLFTPEQLLPAAVSHGHRHDPVKRLWELLRLERGDVSVILIFALFVGLLTLASPIAVEALVNTVAFGRMLQPVFILSLMLFTFLALAAALRAAQLYVVEILQRRLFVRLASDLALRLPRVQEAALDGTHPPELVNRFLEVVTVQKVTAQILLDGVQIVLGGLVGMALLAVYHPWLLGFDLFLMLLFAVLVFLLGRGAIDTSVRESKYKYRLTAWFEEMARCRNSFRLPGGARLAAEQADRVITHYLEARQEHFRILWRQILFALAVQAIASTVLLGLGGWLVIIGQLTLGQLVAAELIVAVIVGSFAKLGKHFEAFYDLVAAIDKLGALLDLPLESATGVLASTSTKGAQVQFSQVRLQGVPGRAPLDRFSLRVEAGERVAVLDGGQGEGSALADLLFGLRQAEEGVVQLNGLRTSELRRDRLRSHVMLLRDIEVFEGTIAENLAFDQPQWSRGQLLAALEAVGLGEMVAALPAGLDMRLGADGTPLTAAETRLLMLARAIALRPRLLVIDRLLDPLPDDMLPQVIDMLFGALPQTTMLVVTGRRLLAQHCHRTVEIHPPPRAASAGARKPIQALSTAS